MNHNDRSLILKITSLAIVAAVLIAEGHPAVALERAQDALDFAAGVQSEEGREIAMGVLERLDELLVSTGVVAPAEDEPTFTMPRADA